MNFLGCFQRLGRVARCGPELRIVTHFHRERVEGERQLANPLKIGIYLCAKSEEFAQVVHKRKRCFVDYQPGFERFFRRLLAMKAGCIQSLAGCEAELRGRQVRFPIFATTRAPLRRYRS